MTNIKNQNVRRAYSAFFLLALLVSMFSGTVGRLDLGMVSVASACQTGKPCEDANGSPTIQEPKEEEVVTVDVGDVQATVVSLSNNGGGTPNLNAQGVQTQAINGTNNSTITLSVPAGTQLDLPAETNATIIYTNEVIESILSNSSLSSGGLPGGTNNLPGVGNVNNNGQQNGGNPQIVEPAILAEFLTTLSVECPYPSSDAAVDCWNHFVFNNVYTENGGNIHHDCRDTGNANNPMLKPNGGTVVKLSMLYWDVYYGRAFIGEPTSCSHGGPR